MSLKIGGKVGDLTVLDIKTFKKEGTERGYTYGICQCACGNTKPIRVDHLDITKDIYTKTCGCAYSKRGISRRKLYVEFSYDNWYKKFLKGAKLRNYEVTLTKDEIFHYTQKNCFYCDKPPSNVYKPNKHLSKFVYNGLDRVDNTKGYILGNVVPCCKQCNIAKHTQTTEQFFDMVKAIYHKHCI